MPETKSQQATAPYASWKSFMTFLELLADMGLPQRIDRTVMSKMSGATQSNIRVTLNFLKLTDSDGKPTDTLRGLVANHGVKEGWQDALRTVVLTAYEPVIADLSLETGTADQLWKRFREHGNVQGSTLSRAVRFFLAALREAGLRSSPYFKAPPRRRPAKGKQEVEKPPGTPETPTPRKSAKGLGSNGGKQKAAENRRKDRRVPDWRCHPFHLPNYEEPVEVRAPRGITQEEWELINLFMTGTIKLARADHKPSPPDCSEDEG